MCVLSTQSRYPYWRILWPNCDPTFGQHLGGLWNGQALQVLSYQRHMFPAWGPTIASITGVSRLFRLRYDISVQRQEQEVCMAGLAGIQRRDWHIYSSGQSSLWETECWQWIISENRKTYYYCLWQNQCNQFSERDTKNSLLWQESSDGQAAAYKRCSPSAYSACSVSGGNLNNKHTNTASGSFCTGFWLEQSSGLVDSSVNYYSRGFKIMQGIAEMHLQRRLLKLHMWQSWSGLLTTMQM